MNFIANYWYVWLALMIVVPLISVVISLWLTIDSTSSKRDNIVVLNVIVLYVSVFIFGVMTSLSLILNIIRWAKNV